VRLNNLSSH